MNQSECKQVKKDFGKIVRIIAQNVYKNQMYKDNIYDVDDLIQVGMLKLEHCLKLYSDKPIEEFKALTYVAIRREQQNMCETDVHTTPFSEEKYNQVKAASRFDDVDLDLPEKLNKLVGLLKRDTSKRVLSELINPSQKTLDIAKRDIEDKQKLVEQGHNVRVPRTLDIKQRHIRESLGLTVNQYDKALKEVRDTATLVFEVEDSFFRRA